MKLRFFLLLPFLFLGACDDTSETPLATRSVENRVADARERNDGPAIWVAKDYDSTLYLFGTVHLLPDDLSWQREDMRQAFQEAGTVFFEVDTGPEGQVQATVLTTSLGLRDDGLRLTDELDNYQRNLMEAAANNGNLTIAALDSMYPWLASEFLTFAAAQNAGLSADLSADEALKSRAARLGKNIIYLETMEDQITASAELPDFVQGRLLTETLENFNTMGDDLVTVAEQWAVGGTDYLTEELVAPMKARAPEVFHALLRDRNRKWATQLSRFMEDSGTGFVAVGTSHLLGEESLLHELREQGYEVQRYYAFKGENVIDTVDTTITRQ
ncbi:TraB/GumN family protein [Litorimonas sp. WD9-15]|uniref:TraB/GumN family protein n=1 Tax=Litorimonas sp. WD9-15 TaxID=3418716 RepID=UPI003D020EA4